MALNYRLQTDEHFQDAMDKQSKIRVFQDDHIIASGATIVRFDEQTIVLQSSVSELDYLSRQACEFFEVKKQ